MKVIKLTESDLRQIVQKVIDEQTGPGLTSFNSDSLRFNTNDALGIKTNINPKNLKLGDGGKTSLEKRNDVIELQKKLIDLGLLKTKTGKPTGFFGALTNAALDRYQGKSPKTTTTQNKTISKQTTLSSPKDYGFILIWAFPEYEPKIDGKGKIAQFLGSAIRITSGGGKEGTYGKLGHGGCVVIRPNGDSTCYEFGRYPGAKKGYGKVLTHPLGRIAKIKNGVLVNPEEVAMAARKQTYPPGPTMSMSVAVVKLPNPSEAEKYASVKQRDYTAADFSVGDEDANCGTFARDVAYAGGVKMGTFCFPTPNAVVNSFRDKADKMFKV
jgi:peptidoglycan hydrolase-like protein with peptidoglycan-binding domain